MSNVYCAHELRQRASTRSNEEGLEKVLNKIRGEIRSAVKQSGLTMVRSRFDTSDIVQESLLQIWNQIKDSDVDQLEFTRGLLSVIAKGHARKLWRFHLAQKRSIAREQAPPRPATTRESEPLDQVSIREEIGLLLDAMRYIHPARQLIIFRRFFDNASYQEIGDEMCRPREWVRRQHLNAQKEIRILLGHRS